MQGEILITGIGQAEERETLITGIEDMADEQITELIGKMGAVEQGLKDLSRTCNKQTEWCRDNVNALYKMANKAVIDIKENKLTQENCQDLHDKMNGVKADNKDTKKDEEQKRKANKRWWIERILGFIIVSALVFNAIWNAIH